MCGQFTAHRLFDVRQMTRFKSINHSRSVYVTCGHTHTLSTMQQDCPNGRLTPAKFVDMYKMFFPSGNAEEFCDHVFRTFDMDQNGYIDFKVSQHIILHAD